MDTDLSAADLADGRGLLLLAVRLFAQEIDAPLYQALLRNDSSDAAPEDRLIDDELRTLGTEQALDELAVEFCRLFVGPRPECPPYESLHRGETMVGGRSQRRIQDFMNRHGLAATLPAGLPVLSHDHLAVELALLHRLCDDAATAHEFAEHYLLPWAPAYLQDLHSAARLAPYRTIAAFTGKFLTTMSCGHR